MVLYTFKHRKTCPLQNKVKIYASSVAKKEIGVVGGFLTFQI
jgi:hypothetical protein